MQTDQGIQVKSEEMKKVIFTIVDIVNQTNYTKIAIDGIQSNMPKEAIFVTALDSIKV